eukprot:TRINITY_DN17834_c0_g1::TRINITY_DN17834_c0_g1_i1::g.11778::m.11778 TRINITY_DN17834_c0_g1::TRINITY_DN17834_c0_g1_i1::g.11778  ORF type:complete len:175 (-),score=30.49,sp/Q24595/XPC_DROME/31.08/5e-08,BHD_3/PF10405.4/0.00017,BHD_3/PF10405.4/4.9e+02 TRINITY_DN17834_c0_g1_i1:6-530(-)
MLGFDVRNGKPAPKIEGIVICKEFEQEVLKAYEEDEAQRIAREEAKRRAEAVAVWRFLIRTILARKLVGEKYGLQEKDSQGIAPGQGDAITIPDGDSEIEEVDASGATLNKARAATQGPQSSSNEDKSGSHITAPGLAASQHVHDITESPIPDQPGWYLKTCRTCQFRVAVERM